MPGPFPIDGGTLPVQSTADVLAVFPTEVRRATTAPVRDALVAALTEILCEYQRRARQCAAMSDILRARRDALTGIGDDHDLAKQEGEDDTSYRARLLGVPELVTPAAIMAAVNAILAPHTTLTAKYFEASVDRLFLSGTNGVAWHSFLFETGTGASPQYPDRLYPDDAAANGGDAIADREVLGGWCFNDQLGRYFVLRLPQLESLDGDGAYAIDAADDGMWIADGSDTAGAESDGSDTSFIFTDIALSTDIYGAIVDTVELLKGQGMRWAAYVDPLL